MQHAHDVKTPSSKVGLVLIFVVLVVAGTIFATQIKKLPPVADLKNVELVVERKTGSNFKSGDSDEDGLPDWLEEFYKTDENNADTDGDGTKDGDEVKIDRDPAVAGPNDPLITRKDLINTNADMTNFVPGTLTDAASVELFSQYLALKQKGLLKPEDEAKMIEEISKKAVGQSSLKAQYTRESIQTVSSTKQSITAYGERYAQLALDAFLTMDANKNLKDMEYLMKVGTTYKEYAQNVAVISVPDVFTDVHLALINQLYNTGVFFETLSKTDSDPLASMIITAQYQASGVSEVELYTTLSNYFKNNAIIFDTDSTSNFWKKFEN